MAESARNQNVEALRGLAAALVLVLHASEVYAPLARAAGHGTAFVHAALAVDIGRTGVVLFFLISGYAVSSSLRRPGSSVGSFAIRRVFRLYPLFWLSVALAAALLAPASAPALVANLSMVPEVLGVPQLLGIYWTLETELASYVIAAVLFASGQFNRAPVLIGMCLGLLALFALLMFGVLPPLRLLQWQMLPHNLALILWGSLFQLAFDPSARAAGEDDGARHRLRVAALAMAVVVMSPSLYSMFAYLRQGDPSHLRWGVSYPAAMAVFLLAFFWKGRVPRLALWAGTVSYSMYLMHPFVIEGLMAALRAAPAAAAAVPTPAFAALVVGATTAVASLTYVLVERPAIRIGRRLEQGYKALRKTGP